MSKHNIKKLNYDKDGCGYDSNCSIGNYNSHIKVVVRLPRIEDLLHCLVCLTSHTAIPPKTS